MPSLIWTPPALADVQRLYRFLAPKNPAAARRAVKAIRAAAAILSEQPRAGRPVENMEPDDREWPVDFGRNGYLLLYRLHGDRVVVLAVRHRKEAGY